jgi:hypothetical protein
MIYAYKSAAVRWLTPAEIHCREIGLEMETLDLESDESACAASLAAQMTRAQRKQHANATDEISVDREDR